MKKILLIFLTLFLGGGPCFAAFSRGDAGTTTAQFLKLGAGAKAAGMGEAFTGVVNDATAVYWNPAALNLIGKDSASFMHAALFEGISYQWLSYAHRTMEMGVLGVGIQYLTYGSIVKRDNTGLESGSFSPSDLCVSLSSGWEIADTVPAGATLKYISSKIEDSASTLALDLGVSQTLMDDRLVLGAVIQNLGTGLKFEVERSPLPFTIRTGGSYLIRDTWKVALDLNAPVDNAPSFALGTEYLYMIKDGMVAAGRMGFNTRRKDTGGFNSLSFGFGVIYGNFTFDYAFVPYGDLGITNRISLGANFW